MLSELGILLFKFGKTSEGTGRPFCAVVSAGSVDGDTTASTIDEVGAAFVLPFWKYASMDDEDSQLAASVDFCGVFEDVAFGACWLIAADTDVASGSFGAVWLGILVGRTAAITGLGLPLRRSLGSLIGIEGERVGVVDGEVGVEAEGEDEVRRVLLV